MSRGGGQERAASMTLAWFVLLWPAMRVPHRVLSISKEHIHVQLHLNLTMRHFNKTKSLQVQFLRACICDEIML